MGNQCIQLNPNLMLPNLQFPWMCIPLGFYFHPQNGLPSHWGWMQSVPGNPAIKSELTRVYNWKCWKWLNLQHVQWSIISRNSSGKIWANLGCTFGNAGSNQYVWLNQQNVQWSIIARKSGHKIWVKPSVQLEMLDANNMCGQTCFSIHIEPNNIQVKVYIQPDLCIHWI